MLTSDREAGKLRVLLRWRGGWIDERELTLRLVPEPERTPEATCGTGACAWAQHQYDHEVAEELRRRGLRTARGL